MRQLSIDEYDFFTDNYSYILPSIETIWLFDFFTYCKKYKKVWNEILKLPIRIKQARNWQFIKEFNRLIKKTTWKQYFHIKKVENWELGTFNIFETNFWLYLLFLIFAWLDWDDDMVSDALEKLLSTLHITLKPKNKLWQKLFSALTVNKWVDRYEDWKYASDTYAHIILYNELKRSWEASIKISKNLPIEIPFEAPLFKEKEYTYKMHEDFTKFIQEVTNIKIHNNVWDYFDVIIENDSLLILWYLVFNEFVLWKHTIFARWDICLPRDESIWRDLPIFCEHVIASEEWIWIAVGSSSSSLCLTLKNIWYQDVYSKPIDDLKTVQKLRKSLKPTLSEEAEDNSWENELIEEIKIVRQKTDHANIILDLNKQWLQSSETRFHVRDISRIDEMKAFTQDTWWVSIQNYKWSKNHIEWKRMKFYWKKKNKNWWKIEE